MKKPNTKDRKRCGNCAHFRPDGNTMRRLHIGGNCHNTDTPCMLRAENYDPWDDKCWKEMA